MLTSQKTKKLVSAVMSCLMLASPAVLTSCSGGEEYAEYNYFIMDTYVTLKLGRENENGRLDDKYLDEVAENCSEILVDIDSSVSCHNENSDVYRLNSDYDFILSADETMTALLDIAETVSNLTDGAFDYTLGGLTELWNVTENTTPPTDDEIKEALAHAGRDKISVSGDRISKLDVDVKIDFGGIGKGMAAQKILEYLDTTDVEYGLVSVGGNIGVYGKKSDGDDYKIGVRDPHDTSDVVGYCYLTSGFVSVSGDYERFFEYDGKRYHHIIDPSTGYPAESGISSVAVISPNGAAADALSTALFIMGVERSLEFYEEKCISFEAVFVTTDGEIITTSGLGDKFEIKK